MSAMKHPFDFNNNGKLDIPELEIMARVTYAATHRHDDDNDDYVEEYDTYRKKPEERTFDLSDDDAEDEEEDEDMDDDFLGDDDPFGDSELL